MRGWVGRPNLKMEIYSSCRRSDFFRGECARVTLVSGLSVGIPVDSVPSQISQMLKFFI